MFSPDSRHIAFGGTRHGKSVVVVDGQESKEYAAPAGRLVFDGSALVRVVVCREDESFNQELLRVEIETAEEKRP